MEDDVGAARQVAVVGGVHQALTGFGPFGLVRVQVDEVRGMDAQPHALLYAGLFDGGTGLFADAHRAHPTQFERF